MFYIQSFEDFAGSQLQFESHVPTIIKNFISHLQANYQKIFAETVLMNIKADTSEEVVRFDMARIQEIVTRCRFRLDISFLCLLASHHPNLPFEKELDLVFKAIIERNFREFGGDLRVF